LKYFGLGFRILNRLFEIRGRGREREREKDG